MANGLETRDHDGTVRQVQNDMQWRATRMDGQRVLTQTPPGILHVGKFSFVGAKVPWLRQS